MDDGGKWRPTYDRPIRRCWSSAYDKQNCLASRSPPNPGILNFSDQEVQGSAPIHLVVPPEANKVSVSFERNDERDAVSEPLGVECVFLMDSLILPLSIRLGTIANRYPLKVTSNEWRSFVRLGSPTWPPPRKPR